MVITCPACSARYRLNPDKIKGRGAKITCPKCSHVFVVFSDASTGATGEAPAAAPPPPAPRKDADTTTGAFRAVGLDEADIPGTTGKIRVVAPGDRKTRRAVRALSRDGVPAQIGTQDVPVAEEDDSYEPATASELDFRSVGITTWKVKVSIGLIYDFSDISTLKKYLADKKVTEDGLSAHNAKDWTRIGDIPDLDQHFIETWKAAKADIDAGGGPKKKKATPAADTSQGANTTGAQTLATGNYSPATSTGFGTGSHNTVPTSSQRSSSAGRAAPTRSRTPKAPPPPDHSGRNRIMVLAGVGAAALFGAWFLMSQQTAPPPPVETAVATEPDPSAGLPEAEEKRIKDRIQDQMDEQRKAIEAEEAAAEAEAGGEKLTAQEKIDKGLVKAVGTPTDRQLTRVPRQTDSQFRQPKKLPQQQPRQKQPAPVAQKQPSSAAKETVKTDSDPGKMYLTTGLKKLASGNFGSARSMCEKAVEKSPNNAQAWECIGDAKKNLGDAAGAGAAYKKAQDLGSKTAGQ